MRPRRSPDDALMVGDYYGNPVDGAGWRVECRSVMNRTEGSSRQKNMFHGGPCHFRPTGAGCAKQPDKEMELRRQCFFPVLDKAEADLELGEIAGFYWRKSTYWQCFTNTYNETRLEEKNGFAYQIGGPPLNNHEEECKATFRNVALPYEVGLVLDFKVDEDNIPMGCAHLDEEWDSKKWYRKGYPSPPHIFGTSKTPEDERLVCGKPAHAVHVDTFAEDGHKWQETFFKAWEKVVANGYSEDQLKEGPAEGYLQI